jgi:hypothetical protein
MPARPPYSGASIAVTSPLVTALIGSGLSHAKTKPATNIANEYFAIRRS